MTFEVARVIAVGFALGLHHALDSDHVVAVSTILSKSRSLRRSLTVGAVWGLGHTVTVMAVGAVMVLLNWRLPPSWSTLTDLLVAAMLIALGVSVLRSDQHPPHAIVGHDHDHSTSHRSPLRALWVGMVHGMAGSAAVGLLALSAVQSRGLAVAYLLVFGGGTVVGMTALTGILSLGLGWGSRGSGGRTLVRAVGFASVVFGVVLAVQTLGRARDGEHATSVLNEGRVGALASLGRHV